MISMVVDSVRARIAMIVKNDTLRLRPRSGLVAMVETQCRIKPQFDVGGVDNTQTDSIVLLRKQTVYSSLQRCEIGLQDIDPRGLSSIIKEHSGNARNQKMGGGEQRKLSYVLAVAT